MATRKFLTSVADVYAYDALDNILFTGKTLLDSSIEVSLGSAPVRGGRGNQLQYIYYHTGEMKFTLTETQWNLQMLGETVGSDYEPGKFYEEETVVVTASSGSVTQTPLAFEGTTIYGWATSPLGITQRITLSSVGGFTVTGDETSGNWCVRYYTENLTSGQSITINANMIPSVIKLVLETQLNSADVTTNKIGVVQVIAPRVVLSGAFTLSMKADGVSNTPLTGTALAYTPADSSADACATVPYYAKIVEIIDSTNWYDGVQSISISGGDFALSVGETETLAVYAVSSVGYSFKAPVSGLTFATSASPIAEVTAAGVVTAVSAGSASISVVITSASTIDTSSTVTVT